VSRKAVSGKRLEKIISVRGWRKIAERGELRVYVHLDNPSLRILFRTSSWLLAEAELRRLMELFGLTDADL
jgi:predicted RNA binding protein YcfA (HicA-like mRNA interferase family)